MFLGIFLNKPKLIVTKFTNSSSFGTIFRLFPVFLPDFSKRAHYRVTRFTLFLVELHKAEWAFFRPQAADWRRYEVRTR